MIIDKGKSVLIGNPVVSPSPRKIYSIIADRTNAFGDPTTLTSEVINTTGTTFTFGTGNGSNPFSIQLDDPSFLTTHIFTISFISSSYFSVYSYNFDESLGRFEFLPDISGGIETFYITIEFLEI